MYRPLPPVTENLDELCERLRRERDAERKRRLHLLVLMARGQVHTRQEAAEHLAVHRITIGQWLKRYVQEGLEGLLRLGARGAPAQQRTISAAAYEALQARLAEPEGFGSYGAIQQWLAQAWGETVGYSAVHRWVHGRLKAKLKRPRPRHPKKNDAASAAFPQRLDRAVAAILAFGGVEETRPLRLFYQDESRIGLHLPAGRRLTLPGVKPYRVMCPLYQYYWLYAAVEPASGEAFWLEMPRLDSGCFQSFLDHFSHHYPDSLNVLVIDNAPAHVAKTLQVPDNVILIDLPPYCPELNPVERLWQDLKRRLVALGAQVRLSIDGLRQAVDQCIRDYTPEQLASLTGYPYLLSIVLK